VTGRAFGLEKLASVIHKDSVLRWYRNGAGNYVEENSGVFSLI